MTAEAIKINDVQERVRNLICGQLAVSSAQHDDNIYEDLGADSLDSVELRIEIEHTFGIEITDQEFDTWECVRDILNTVNKLIQ